MYVYKPIVSYIYKHIMMGVRESGRRFSLGEGLAEVVQSHFKSPCLMTLHGHRVATVTTAGRAVVLVAMEAATVVVATIVVVMVLAIMVFIVLVMLMSMPILLLLPRCRCCCCCS
jgi:hypothetical protein